MLKMVLRSLFSGCLKVAVHATVVSASGIAAFMGTWETRASESGICYFNILFQAGCLA